MKAVSLALAGLLAAASAHAGTVAVYVGYADGLRAGADYPTPFASGTAFGGHAITNFVGNLSGSPDSGAVMIINTGMTDAVITNLDVNNRATSHDYQIWTGGGAGQLGAGITLHAGQGAIFAENAGNNFDSSDYSNSAFTGATQTGTTFDATTNNCSNGAIAASVACTGSFPILTFTVNSGAAVFNDTAHVLDTGGFDSANYPHLHNGPNGPVYTLNESLGWRLIGTTGIGNPGGGNVPEPASLAVLGLGLAGFAAARRRFA